MATWTLQNKYNYYDLQQFELFDGDIHTYLNEWKQDIYIYCP
jgi:hypothetical protein